MVNDFNKQGGWVLIIDPFLIPALRPTQEYNAEIFLEVGFLQF